MRQFGELAEAAFECRQVFRRFHNRGDGLVAMGGLAAAEIAHAVGSMFERETYPRRSPIANDLLERKDD